MSEQQLPTLSSSTTSISSTPTSQTAAVSSSTVDKKTKTDKKVAKIAVSQQMLYSAPVTDSDGESNLLACFAFNKRNNHRQLRFAWCVEIDTPAFHSVSLARLPEFPLADTATCQIMLNHLNSVPVFLFKGNYL
jgi:hypothetical protein